MQISLTDRDAPARTTEAAERRIGAAAETTAAFIGRTLRGPLDTPVEITSFAAFCRRFGGSWHRSCLAPAVLQFFEHGGRQLYVVRVANDARGALVCLPASRGVLVLRAREPGSTERIRAAVDYDGIHPGDDTHFNLTLQRIAPDSGLVVEQEIYRRLSCDDDERNFIGAALARSGIVRLQAPAPGGRPLPTLDGARGPGYSAQVQAGTDGSPLSDYDLVGSAVTGSGLFSLDAIPRLDLVYMPPPGKERELGPAATLAAEMYCRRRGAMLILDPPAAWDSAQAAVAGIRRSGLASANVVSYWPRIRQQGTEQALPRAAGGALAGLLCRLDRNYGPWEELDRRALSLRRELVPAVDLDVEDAALLTREGLNVIARDGAGPATVRGSVTLARNSRMDRHFASLSARRLCLAITNALERETRWAVFERGSLRATERLNAQVRGYLSGLAEAGAFANDSYDATCSVSTSRLDDPQGGVTILLTFRPARSRDAVTLTVQQTVAGCRVTTTAFAPARSRRP